VLGRLGGPPGRPGPGLMGLDVGLFPGLVGLDVGLFPGLVGRLGDPVIGLPGRPMLGVGLFPGRVLVGRAGGPPVVGRAGGRELPLDGAGGAIDFSRSYIVKVPEN
jgi:hypothetical protein